MKPLHIKHWRVVWRFKNLRTISDWYISEEAAMCAIKKEDRPGFPCVAYDDQRNRAYIHGPMRCKPDGEPT